MSRHAAVLVITIAVAALPIAAAIAVWAAADMPVYGLHAHEGDMLYCGISREPIIWRGTTCFWPPLR